MSVIPGPQVRHPPRGYLQEGGRKALHQGSQDSAPGHPPAPAAQAPPHRTQAPSRGGLQGRRRTFLPTTTLYIQYADMNTERLRPDPLQAHLRGQGFARRGPQAPRFLHAPLDSSSPSRGWRWCWWCHDTTLMKSRECFTFGVCVGRDRASCCLEAETSGSKGAWASIPLTAAQKRSCLPNDTIALLHYTDPTILHIELSCDSC